MTPRELAAAIRKGHTMIEEDREIFLIERMGILCGCALGAAWVGAGRSFQQKEYICCDNPRMSRLDIIGNALGIPGDIASRISAKHYHGMPRLAIADWLDTLEPETKPADKQTFERFLADVLKPVDTQVEERISQK